MTTTFTPSDRRRITAAAVATLALTAFLAVQGFASASTGESAEPPMAWVGALIRDVRGAPRPWDGNGA